MCSWLQSDDESYILTREMGQYKYEYSQKWISEWGNEKETSKKIRREIDTVIDRIDKRDETDLIDYYSRSQQTRYDGLIESAVTVVFILLSQNRLVA